MEVPSTWKIIEISKILAKTFLARLELPKSSPIVLVNFNLNIYWPCRLASKNNQKVNFIKKYFHLELLPFDILDRFQDSRGTVIDLDGEKRFH